MLATHQVVIEMVRATALTHFEGARLWRGLNRDTRDYDRRLGKAS